ncbi:MAG: hypothetical protein J0M33_15560 [Anaerolineae bacterium]|nr:hypothetical protein [Anaerolineae bacterium]
MTRKSPPPNPEASGPLPTEATPTIPGRSPLTAPWLLQGHYAGSLNLERELLSRYPSQPLLSVVRTGKVDKLTRRATGSVSAQDGSAGLIIEADARAGMQLLFNYGSAMGLRFHLDDTSGLDRARWIDLMRQPKGGIVFLWGQNRWERDYLICVLHNGFSSFYAFSRNGYEAATRLTPDATTKLINWLESIWPEEDTSSPAPADPLTAAW